MAENISTAPESGQLATDAATPGGTMQPGQPQSGGDSRLAGILAKQASGETLTASERGYLGAVRRRGMAKAPAAKASNNPLLAPEPKPEPMAKAPLAPPAAPADNPLFADQAQPENPIGGLAVSAADSEVIRLAAEAILDGMDTTTKLYIAYEARAAGGDELTVRRYEAAVALNPSNRKLMSENSEPVVLALCKFFGCSPDKLASVLKNSAFMCGLFAHVTAVAATVKSIRESAKEKPAQN